ncbi:hypothetical protein DN730_10045 [Marinomonas piezotolerans]|uniref:Entry exclusion lipoprotein TrbK n=1 Tax=Marinomonas piezotolerans TaxID=2213058 RepID=A0A370UAC6_9GAMM|nr:hypothetical protein [Marinomonas piezotolerans]RDL44714.1 hypothetical protein DN730_10045 [Marinomonas piezotolerans]
MRMPITVGTILVIASLSGCDMFAGPSADIPDAELRKKWRECKTISNPSRTKVLACENYERECARRKGKGNIACY